MLINVSSPSEFTGEMDENAREDDIQIASAAEAMVQLSGGYSQQHIQDESMDVDPNYDPSDFLGNLNNREPREQKPQLDINIAQYEQMNTYKEEPEETTDNNKPAAIHDDLAISDSDEEQEPMIPMIPVKQENLFEVDQATSSQAQVALPPPPSNPDVKDENDDADNADNDLLWF